MILSQVPWANGFSHSFHLSHLIHQLWIKLFWKTVPVLCRHTFPGRLCNQLMRVTQNNMKGNIGGHLGQFPAQSRLNAKIKPSYYAFVQSGLENPSMIQRTLQNLSEEPAPMPNYVALFSISVGRRIPDGTDPSVRLEWCLSSAELWKHWVTLGSQKSMFHLLLKAQPSEHSPRALTTSFASAHTISGNLERDLNQHYTTFLPQLFWTFLQFS